MIVVNITWQSDYRTPWALKLESYVSTNQYVWLETYTNYPRPYKIRVEATTYSIITPLRMLQYTDEGVEVNYIKFRVDIRRVPKNKKYVCKYESKATGF